MSKITLLNPFQLKPHEQISKIRGLYLLIKIIFTKKFVKPLLIDKKTKTILDGHHRCWVAKKLGLKKIPCYCIDYINNKKVKVYPRRYNISVNKLKIIKTAMKGHLFPQKTTRHIYTLPKTKPIFIKDLV